MATKTTKSTKNATTKKESVEEIKKESEAKAPEKENKYSNKSYSINDEDYVTVRNGFQGRLVYRSSRTGETFVWDNFGDEQEMQVRELKNAKNSNKRFFIDNWFMFDDIDIVLYLGLGAYYKNALDIDNFDDIFNTPAEKLAERINELSEGQKKSVMYRAYDLIAENKIDSLKKITTLEEIFGVSFRDV